MKKISIITPCFNEKENLIECCERIKKIFNNELKTFDYEHIIVDNNSDGETYKIIKDLTSNDKKIKALINNKNYGSSFSHSNAIKFSDGDAVITFLASDLQDPPEMIPQFIKKWQLGYDFVVGIRKTRQEFIVMKFIRKIFYKIISFISGRKIFDGVSDYQIIDKKITNEKECTLILQQLGQKIGGYKAQDIHKNLYLEAEFVDVPWTLDLMKKCNNHIFFLLNNTIL